VEALLQILQFALLAVAGDLGVLGNVVGVLVLAVLVRHGQLAVTDLDDHPLVRVFLVALLVVLLDVILLDVVFLDILLVVLLDVVLVGQDGRRGEQGHGQEGQEQRQSAVQHGGSPSCGGSTSPPKSPAAAPQ